MRVALVIVYVLLLMPVLAFAQDAVTCATKTNMKTADINNDGKHDVVYYHDGENITKIEADTNFDGKHDLVIHADKEGNFKSAEADSDFDGKFDKQFSNPKDFNEWLNKDNAVFKDALGWQDKSYKIMNF